MKYIEKDRAYKIVLHYGSYAASAKIADLPSIDLVRCKECRWGHLCVIGQHLGLDGFCSKGEREVQE